MKLRVAAFQIIQMPNKFVFFSLKKELRVNLKCVFFSLGLYNRKKNEFEEISMVQNQFHHTTKLFGSSQSKSNKKQSQDKSKVKPVYIFIRFFDIGTVRLLL